jgi:hypothetical protein
MQSLYLEGYGVVFLMKMDFPLSPPPQVQKQDETETEEDGDKVWRDTRRQLYEPEKLAKPKKSDSAPKYDAEKVENLKTTLTEALKHAANIRTLKADESVILSITGSSSMSSGVKAVRPIPNTNKVLVVDQNGKTYEVDSGGRMGLAAPTVLVIRAKKADIDSFAKGTWREDLSVEMPLTTTTGLFARRSETVVSRNKRLCAEIGRA